MKFETSKFTKESQPLNIYAIASTLLVLNLNKSKFFKDLQFLNIPFKYFAFDISKSTGKIISFKLIHSESIKSKFSVLEKLKLDKLIVFNDLHE